MPEPREHTGDAPQPTYDFDWNQLAFASKKPVSALSATFIAAPRQLSEARIKELIKTYLPKGNVVIGLAKEQYVQGLAGNPAFQTLQRQEIQHIVDKINQMSPRSKLYTLRYFQRDLPYLLEKLDFARVVLVRGSWHTSFHLQPAYYVLANKNTPFEYISPFTGEAEAKAYATVADKALNSAFTLPATGTHTAEQMLELANAAAKHSLDYTYQTGVTLGKKSGAKYQLLAWTYNRVVPFQTYAMHYGNSREMNFSPPNDLNHYDAVHAEVEMVIKAGREGINLKNTTFFINLLPCPTCARMLAETEIPEFVYTEDHSNGYAVHMLEAAGKKVRRIA